MSPVGAAGRHILRACWRARGPVVLRSKYRAVVDELAALGLVTHDRGWGEVNMRVTPTPMGFDVGRALCLVEWARLWRELGDELLSRAALLRVQGRCQDATVVGRRARRARLRSRDAFVRAFGHVEGVATVGQ